MKFVVQVFLMALFFASIIGVNIYFEGMWVNIWTIGLVFFYCVIEYSILKENSPVKLILLALIIASLFHIIPSGESLPTLVYIIAGPFLIIQLLSTIIIQVVIGYFTWEITKDKFIPYAINKREENIKNTR